MIHGALVTAYGRLVLLNLMERVPEGQMCYCDTDSIQFLLHASQADPFTNELTGNLGELTDEVCLHNEARNLKPPIIINSGGRRSRDHRRRMGRM